MTILIKGDRRSKIIKIARRLQKKFPKLFKVTLWDGYKTVIEVTK